MSRAKSRRRCRRPEPYGLTAVRWTRLLLDFDDVSPYDLDSLVALRRKVSPGFRLVECQSVVHAIPFDDRQTLGGRLPFYLNDPSGRGAQGATMGHFNRLAGRRQVCGLGCSIEDFALAD